MGKLTDDLGRFTVSVDLRQWCEEQNHRPLTERVGRWYYVREVDGVNRAECLDGTDGANVHKLLNGKLDDFVGWPPKRMEGYRRWLWTCATQGLTEEAASRLGRQPALEPA